MLNYRARIKDIDAKSAAFGQVLNFDKFKVDEKYVTGWLHRICEIANTDVVLAKSKITSLVGEFVLSPETIGGIRHIHMRGNAWIDGLLTIAAGRRVYSDKQIPGGGLEPLHSCIKLVWESRETSW